MSEGELAVLLGSLAALVGLLGWPLIQRAIYFPED